MKSILRGFRSFRRHPGRNLVIVLLLFVCLAFSLSMLAVKLAADSQVESIKETVGTYGEIRVSSEYELESFEREIGKSKTERQQEARSMSEEEEFSERVNGLVPEEITDGFSQDPYIVTYDKVLSAGITVPGVTNTELETLLKMKGPGGQGGIDSETFFFEGNTNGPSASDFTTGQKNLIDGSLYTYADYQAANPVVVIEKNLAEENELAVGDTFEANLSGETGKDARFELEVIGIYETVVAEGEDSSGSKFDSFNPAGNKFFAPLSVVQELNATPGYVELGSYYFDNVDNTGALEKAFNEELGGETKYEFATDLADYNQIADPLLKVKNTSVIGLAGALGACALIILLAMVITISGRTRELGVLKAIGATNRQVMLQYAVEVLCICMVAIILAMGATALISQPMGDWLLSDNGGIETSMETEEEAGMQARMMKMLSKDTLYKEGGRFSTDSAGEEESTSLDVIYRGSLLGYAVLILLGVSLLGMAVPIIWITRLRPARVLSME